MFFPDSDAGLPISHSSSLSSHPEAPGLRYRHPPQFQPMDVRPRFMYSAGPASEVGMPIASQSPRHIPAFKRKFANRVWTSEAYKKARQQEKFDPPQILWLDTSGDIGAKCKALANQEAIPFIEPGTRPTEAESSHILQCIWARTIIAIVADISWLAPDAETAVALLQATRATSAWTLFTLPRSLQNSQPAYMTHYAPMPKPVHGAGARLHQTAHVALPRLSAHGTGVARTRLQPLPRRGDLTDLSCKSLLRSSGHFAPHRRRYVTAQGA